MIAKLLINHYEAVAVILSGIGLANLLLQRNLIKVYLFLAAKGWVSERAAPILLKDGSEWVMDVDKYVNPIPAGLVLTGIVVSVSVTAFALALTLRFYEKYGSLNIDSALSQMTKEQEILEAEAALKVDIGDNIS